MFEAVIITIFLFAFLWGIVGMVVCVTLGNMMADDMCRDHVSVFKTSVVAFAIAMVLFYAFFI